MKQTLTWSENEEKETMNGIGKKGRRENLINSLKFLAYISFNVDDDVKKSTDLSMV